MGRIDPGGDDGRYRALDRGDVDSGGDAAVGECAGHRLGGDITGRAGREWAAAETAGRAVEDAKAAFEGAQDVSDRLAVGVVEVEGQTVDRERRRGIEQGIGGGEGSAADGVGDAHLVAAEREQARGDGDRRFG